MNNVKNAWPSPTTKDMLAMVSQAQATMIENLQEKVSNIDFVYQ